MPGAGEDCSAFHGAARMSGATGTARGGSGGAGACRMVTVGPGPGVGSAGGAVGLTAAFVVNGLWHQLQLSLVELSIPHHLHNIGCSWTSRWQIPHKNESWPRATKNAVTPGMRENRNSFSHYNAATARCQPRLRQRRLNGAERHGPACLIHSVRETPPRPFPLLD